MIARRGMAGATIRPRGEPPFLEPRRPLGVAPLAALGAIVVGAAVVFATARTRATTYDEGVYLASFDALAHGQRIAEDVYTSQPPIFYAIGRALLAIAGRDLGDIRIAFAILSLVGVVAAWAAGRALFGTAAGLAMAGAVAVAPPIPQNAGLAIADTPSIALAISAVALFGVATRRSSRAWAAAAGVAMGLALCVKLLVLPFLVLLALVAISRRRSARLLPPVAAGVALAVASVALVYVGDLGRLRHDLFGDHVAVAATRGANLDRIALHSVEWKTPFAWLVVAGLLCLVIVPRTRQAWPLWAGVLPLGAFLVALRPLFDHHLVLIAAGLALATGATLGMAVEQLRGRARAAATCGVALMIAAGAFQQQHRLHRDARAEPPDILWAAEVVAAATPRDTKVVTDMPIVAYRADRRVPGDLVDVSYVRLASGSLTTEEVDEEVRRWKPAVVVIRRELRDEAQLLRRLSARYRTVLECGETRLFTDAPVSIACPSPA